MADLFWLSDEQWAVIAPFMPVNQPGPERNDDRQLISGIVHVLKAGCRWCDCPPEYGPHSTVYNRFNRWSRPSRASWTNSTARRMTSEYRQLSAGIRKDRVEARDGGMRLALGDLPVGAERRA